MADRYEHCTQKSPDSAQERALTLLGAEHVFENGFFIQPALVTAHEPSSPSVLACNWVLGVQTGVRQPDLKELSLVKRQSYR